MFLCMVIRVLKVSRMIPAFASEKFVRTFNVMMVRNVSDKFKIFITKLGGDGKHTFLRIRHGWVEGGQKFFSERFQNYI